MTEKEFKEKIFELMHNELIEVEYELMQARREGNTEKVNNLYDVRDMICDTMQWYKDNITN